MFVGICVGGVGVWRVCGMCVGVGGWGCVCGGGGCVCVSPCPCGQIAVDTRLITTPKGRCYYCS